MSVLWIIRSRNAIARLHQRGFILLADDVHAQFDALVADEYDVELAKSNILLIGPTGSVRSSRAASNFAIQLGCADACSLRAGPPSLFLGRSSIFEQVVSDLGGNQ